MIKNCIHVTHKILRPLSLFWPKSSLIRVLLYQQHFMESVNPNPKGRIRGTSLIQQQHNWNHMIHRQRYNLFC